MEFYGGAADKVMGETIPYLEGYTVYTLREPHGVTGHIVPWNYPMQIIGRSVGAALAMGNACVLKPAEEACLTALAFARLAEEARANAEEEARQIIAKAQAEASEEHEAAEDRNDLVPGTRRPRGMGFARTCAWKVVFVRVERPAQRAIRHLYEGRVVQPA